MGKKKKTTPAAQRRQSVAPNLRSERPPGVSSVHVSPNPSLVQQSVLSFTGVHPRAGDISAAERENLRLGNESLRAGMQQNSSGVIVGSTSNGTVPPSSTLQQRIQIVNE